MGKKSKRRAEDLDSEATTGKDGHESGETHEDRAPDTLNGPDFGSYLDVVEELRTQMVVSERSIKNVKKFYKQQKLDIEDAVVNRQKLDKMTAKCQKYKTTIDMFWEYEKERNENLAKKVADIEEKERVLDRVKEEAVIYRIELEKEKETLHKRVKATEAEQKINLQEHRTKLEKEQDEKYTKRMEFLEKKIKTRQDADSKTIEELTAKNAELSQSLEMQKVELTKAESKWQDVEKLKTVYATEAEDLKKTLKLAKNEFGLNARTTEFYTEEFSKTQKKIQDICSEYAKELNIGDLNLLHDKIEDEDEEFSTVPISKSETSEKLRIAHAQRVISTQLRRIIWQPFSSETTLHNPKYVSLFSQISEGLVKFYGKDGGLYAARLCTALIMRGLQSQPSIIESSTSKSSAPLHGRIEIFTEKVMSVLSLLVKPSLHPNLRNNLVDIAKSAISVWDIAQTDEREIIVYSTLDPESHGEPPGDISAPNNGVIVLFPRITAQSCSRITDTSPISSDTSETPKPIQKTSIHNGVGLGESSTLVLEGEAEEDERREKEEETKLEEEKRRLEENLKRLANPDIQRRKISQTRKVSMAGSGAKPSAIWKMGGQAKGEEVN